MYPWVDVMISSNFAVYATTLALLWVISGIARHERRERRAQDLHLWLDTSRPAPAGWRQIDSAAQMIDMLNICGARITAITLGAGSEQDGGYSVLRHIAAMARDGRYVPAVHLSAEDSSERLWMSSEVAMIRRNQAQRLHRLSPAQAAAA
jgi:hypothetical protein